MIIKLDDGRTTLITGEGFIKQLPIRMQPPHGTLCKCGETEAIWWEEDKTEPNNMLLLCRSCAGWMDTMKKLAAVVWAGAE